MTGIEGHPAQDGRAHLSYFHRDSGVSVIAPGNGWIYFCPGGYGEPARLALSHGSEFFRMSMADALDELERLAEEGMELVNRLIELDA